MLILFVGLNMILVPAIIAFFSLSPCKFFFFLLFGFNLYANSKTVAFSAGISLMSHMVVV